jgi:polysaccharide export outer membrane protein
VKGADGQIRTTGVWMDDRRRAARYVLVLAGVVSCIACGGRVISPSPPDPDPMSRESYVIGVLDSVGVTVWRNPDLNVTATVRNDGKISVPLVDDVQAEGLTVMELKAVITKELEEFISAPDVTVIVHEMRSQSVSLIGALSRSGRLPIGRDLRVLDAIISMGGFAPFANKSNVQIVRQLPDGTEETYRFDYKAYVRGQAPGSNIVLRNGDTVIVSE